MLPGNLTLKGHPEAISNTDLGAISSLAFSPDGNRLAAFTRDKTVKMWVAGTARETYPLKGHTEVVLGVAFSPDGRRIAAFGGFHKMVKQRDARPLDADPAKQVPTSC
jgi:WD40 repeat protein